MRIAIFVVCSVALMSCSRNIGYSLSQSNIPNDVLHGVSGSDSLNDPVPYAVLASFGDFSSPAAQPAAGLVQADDGAFYGTTAYGGVSNPVFPLGCGAIYRVTSAGKITPLHEFTCSDGAGPGAALLFASDGLLYGSTTDGYGASSNGLIFRIAPSGHGFRVLHHFGNGPDAGIPNAALIEGKDGKLYGTAEEGPPPNGTGTVFRLDRDGSGYRVLHAFIESEGEIVDTPLLQTANGTLYGTALRGGNPSWAGTIYRLDPDGSHFKVIHYFSGKEGFNPNGGLTRGPDGRLYGEAAKAVSQIGAIIFAVSLDGHVRTIVDLPTADSYPEGGLVLGNDGHFYGEDSGGFGTTGALFSFDPRSKRVQQIHRFRGAPTDGAEPWSRLVLSSEDRRFYGTTIAGGTGACEKHAPVGCGTVFSFAP